MADVVTTDEQRGQILLLGGLTLAALLVLLAVILNGVIYAENVASQGENARADEALEFRNETESAITEGLRVVNANSSLGPSDLERSLQDWEKNIAILKAERGARVSLRVVTIVGDAARIDSVTVAIEYETRLTYYATTFTVTAP